MKNRIHPNWSDIRALKQPLPQGVMQFAEKLDQILPEEWYIYVRPIYNGHKPDLCIFNESYGVTFIHVSELTTENLEPLYEKIQTSHGVVKRKIFIKNNNPDEKIIHPTSVAESYSDELKMVYVPLMYYAILKGEKKWTIVKSAVYYCNVDSQDGEPLFRDNKGFVKSFFKDSTDDQLIQAILPKSDTNEYKLEGDWIPRIKSWIFPSYHSVEEGTFIELSNDQERDAKPTPKKHIRTRGVAGGGKTLVLAQRAARLAAIDKKVLIITFNITLIHYIKHHIERSPYPFDRQNITIRHFHGFCRDYLEENYIPWPKEGGQEVLDNGVAFLVKDLLQRGINKNGRKYDAVLIDEGQDIEGSWYHCLCQFLTENDELFLIVDDRQNLYNRKSSWIDAPRDVKFRGKWRSLKSNYRIPPNLVKIVNLFAELYLGNVGDKIVCAQQLELAYLNNDFEWDNVANLMQAIEKSYQIYNRLIHTAGVKPEDIAILLCTHKEGKALVKYFDAKKVDLHHIFGNQGLKYAFDWYNKQSKASTIHSFKGWEIPNVIIISPAENVRVHGDLSHILYVAMTRSRGNLFVINQRSEYADFGEKVKGLEDK